MDWMDGLVFFTKEWETLKNLIQSALVLHPFQPEAGVVIMTDASADGVGAALLNKIDGQLTTVSCASAISKVENLYSQYEPEHLGVILDSKRFHK